MNSSVAGFGYTTIASFVELMSESEVIVIRMGVEVVIAF